MADQDPVDWAKLADETKANVRPHAGYFSWETNRGVAEEGVLSEFERCLKQQNALFFSDARHRGANNDPPDCEAEDNAGGRVAIEITELVDAASIKAARIGTHLDWTNWKPILVTEIEKIIQRKDKPSILKGGPYAQYVLVIHTDEPWLIVEDARQLLADHTFPPTGLITRAYLLMSYDPIEQQLHCIPMKIQDRDT